MLSDCFTFLCILFTLLWFKYLFACRGIGRLFSGFILVFQPTPPYDSICLSCKWTFLWWFVENELNLNLKIPFRNIASQTDKTSSHEMFPSCRSEVKNIWFICLTGRFLRRHTWVLMGPDPWDQTRTKWSRQGIKEFKKKSMQAEWSMKLKN